MTYYDLLIGLVAGIIIYLAKAEISYYKKMFTRKQYKGGDPNRTGDLNTDNGDHHIATD